MSRNSMSEPPHTVLNNRPLAQGMSAEACTESCCLRERQWISNYLGRTCDGPWCFRKIILETKIREMEEEVKTKTPVLHGNNCFLLLRGNTESRTIGQLLVFAPCPPSFKITKPRNNGSSWGRKPHLRGCSFTASCSPTPTAPTISKRKTRL